MQFTPSISRVTVDSASVGISASGERSSLFKGNLSIFQVRRCRMERYKDSGHAFLVGMLFVLVFVWLSAFVCICFVCLSPFVSDGPSVVSLCCSGLCLSVCLSRTSYVSCLLCLLSVPWRQLSSSVGLGCLVLSYLGLSCLVLSVWHQSVLSLCCVYSSSDDSILRSSATPVSYSSRKF